MVKGDKYSVERSTGVTRVFDAHGGGQEIK